MLHNTEESDHGTVIPWVAAIGAMRSIAEKLIDEGRVEGRVEASRALVVKQLQLKFGVLPAPERAILDRADLETLERYAERVLTAARLADVL